MSKEMKLRDKISKRIVGIVLLSTGLVMKVILFYKAVTVVIADPATAMSVSSTLLWVGLGLLGVDATQKVFKK